MGERTKGKFAHKGNIQGRKFEGQEAVESASRRKPRIRDGEQEYANRMDKHYGMAEHMPEYNPEVYKRKSHGLTGKTENVFPQAMSNDDLYRKIHYQSNTHPQTSFDNLVPRKDTRRHRIAQSPLSRIADEDEEEEVSDPEYTCEARAKPFEDDEADDEIDYESDQYANDVLDRPKDYRRVFQKSDHWKQLYHDWLTQTRLPISRDMEKLQLSKYDRANRGKVGKAEESRENPHEQRRRPMGAIRCSECGKTLEGPPKSGPRGTRMLYDFPEFPNSSGEKPPKFPNYHEEFPCPKPRKPKKASKKPLINHSPAKIDDYYDE